MRIQDLRLQDPGLRTAGLSTWNPRPGTQDLEPRDPKTQDLRSQNTGLGPGTPVLAT